MLSVQPQIFSTSSLDTGFRVSTSDLNQRVDTGFHRVLSDPIEVITGGIFAGFFILDAVRVSLAIKEYVEQKEEPKVYEAKKELALSSASLIGTTANTLSWADSVSLIALNWAAIGVSVIGYVARIFTSGLELYSAMEEFNFHSDVARTATTPQQAKKATEEQTLALIKLSSRIAFIAWAILGIAGLAVMTTALNAASVLLLFVVLGLMIAEMVYKNHINPKNLPVPAPQA